MTEIKVTLPEYHDAQREMTELHRNNRFLAVRAGRRTGKTLWAASEVIKALIRGKRVCWVAPSHALLTAGFAMILDKLHPALVSKKNANEKEYRTITGGSLKGWVASDPKCGRGWEFDLIVIDEAAFGPDGEDTEAESMCAVWERALKPTLLMTLGSCIAVSNTCGVKDDNFFYRITHGAYDFVDYHCPSRANPHLPAEELERLKANTEERTYKQEYEAEWVDWRGAGLISLDYLTPPLNPTHPPMMVFATLDTAIKANLKNDGTAIVYAAYDDVDKRLYILDWDIRQIETDLMSEWMPEILDRIAQYSIALRARSGSVGLWVEDAAGGTVMLQHARRHGMPAYAIDNRIKQLGKDARVTAILDYVYKKQVVLTPEALDKITKYKNAERNHLTKQVCGYIMGEKDQEDDLLDAFTYAVLMAFAPQTLSQRG